MVKKIIDQPSDSKIETHRQIVLEFEFKNAKDKELIEKISKLCSEQDSCPNCVNYYRDGYFCGYQACCCKIHGVLDSFNNPHHDMDGSKCPDYKRRIEV